jgi:Uncharacterized conserved protein
MGYHWAEAVYEIEVDGRLAEALDGIEEFSHIIVLFWFHQAVSREVSPKIHRGILGV